MDDAVSGYANPTCDRRRFREQLYACMKRRSDALFELCDAILTAGTVTSPVHLTLAPAHRREGHRPPGAPLRDGARRRVAARARAGARRLPSPASCRSGR